MQICDVFDLVKLEKNFASLSKKLLSECQTWNEW